jgi:hypothetical protein
MNLIHFAYLALGLLLGWAVTACYYRRRIAQMRRALTDAGATSQALDDAVNRSKTEGR